MGTRSVQLDDEAESALADIIERTGLSIPEAIKQSLISYREAMQKEVVRPSDFFDNYDLGLGGDTIMSARDKIRHHLPKVKR